LLLSRQNPTWTASDIANFFEQSDNPPNLNRHALTKKINYLLARGSVFDRKRSGRPPATTAYRNLVLKEIQIKNKASIRNVTAKLKQQGWKTSPSSVYRITKSAGLKWFKKRRSQKLTYDNKIQRVKSAKRLRRNFGITKRSRNWRWNLIINTDFSGKFTLAAFSNPHNEGIWAKSAEEIPPEILNRPKDKFASGIIFWGGISYDGLIPKNGPFDVTSWLQKQVKDKSRKRIYMNSHLYAKFIKEVGFKEIQKVCRTSFIFQDDADTKQRTKIVLETVDKLFDYRISPQEGDAKFADVWPIENIWGILKEKIRGEQFSSFQQLKDRLNNEWKKITCDDCKKMIDEIPKRLNEVINSDGQQIRKN
ncbi:unnamed protein product, partial [Rotaria sp. Silwood2]